MCSWVAKFGQAGRLTQLAKLLLRINRAFFLCDDCMFSYFHWQANIMLSIFGAIGAWSLSLVFRKGKKIVRPQQHQQDESRRKGHRREGGVDAAEQDPDLFL